MSTGKEPLQGANKQAAGDNTDSGAVDDADRGIITNIFGSMGSQAFHNFSGDKLEVWRMTCVATGPDCKKASDAINKVIRLKWFYCHKVELVSDKTGEITESARCVLIERDETAYAFVSAGLARDLIRLIDAFGKGPYPDGIPLMIRQLDLKNQRRTYQLVPAN